MLGAIYLGQVAIGQPFSGWSAEASVSGVCAGGRVGVVTVTLSDLPDTVTVIVDGIRCGGRAGVVTSSTSTYPVPTINPRAVESRYSSRRYSARTSSRPAQTKTKTGLTIS